MRKLKVYGWQSFRPECRSDNNGNHQTREIVAAPSMAAVARIVGVKYPRQLFNLCETGNPKEHRIAMSEPGVVFWKPISDYHAEWTKA